MWGGCFSPTIVRTDLETNWGYFSYIFLSRRKNPQSINPTNEPENLFGSHRKQLPIRSMYGIFTYIYHKNQPDVGKYTMYTWILWLELLRMTFTGFVALVALIC